MSTYNEGAPTSGAPENPYEGSGRVAGEDYSLPMKYLYIYIYIYIGMYVYTHTTYIYIYIYIYTYYTYIKHVIHIYIYIYTLGKAFAVAHAPVSSPRSAG